MEESKQKKMTIGVLRFWVLLVTLTAPATLASSSNPPPQFNPPKSYYLALGDSFTYGFQGPKFAAGLPPSAYNTGYVDDFGARLRQIQPNITTVNYGCPGESTTSFINGPCPWSAAGQQLHDAFAGSQLDAAVAFLALIRARSVPSRSRFGETISLSSSLMSVTLTLRVSRVVRQG